MLHFQQQLPGLLFRQGQWLLLLLLDLLDRWLRSHQPDLLPPSFPLDPWLLLLLLLLSLPLLPLDPWLPLLPSDLLLLPDRWLLLLPSDPWLPYIPVFPVPPAVPEDP